VVSCGICGCDRFCALTDQRPWHICGNTTHTKVRVQVLLAPVRMAFEISPVVYLELLLLLVCYHVSIGDDEAMVQPDDITHKTPLAIAKACGHSKVAFFLTAHGAKDGS